MTVCALRRTASSARVSASASKCGSPKGWAEKNRGYVESLNRWLDPTLWKLYNSVHDKVRPEDTVDDDTDESWGGWFRGLLSR